jgi:DNA modification methylase
MPRKQANSTLELPFPAREPDPAPRTSLRSMLLAFREFGKATQVVSTAYVPAQADGGREILAYVNEYWTAKQRQAHSLHEISYRACFKPQLPRFFIQHLTRHGEIVYDPFMGRGTTILEAALLGRAPFGCDVNPLSAVLAVLG